MTANYFAPEPRYATEQSHEDGDWIGSDGRQVMELRSMIEGFHNAGLAVIVDVVFNHLAQYGQTPLRQVDPCYSLRVKGSGTNRGESGCGNDFRTEAPMNRRLIVDSLKHWVRFHGVDGFRFDLAGLIDGQTLNVITSELRRELPGILLIAEPWGMKYDHSRFSRRGWGAWNDLFRNGIRGIDPHTGKSFIFGTWGPGNNDHTFVRHVTGTLRADGGPYHDEGHAVNYLSCHDGYTLGDSVRIALGRITHDQPTDVEACMDFTEEELRTLRLAWFILLTSRGAVMFHAGDEWARAKVIRGSDEKDPSTGLLDHNSYEKDDPTNWLNWKQLSLEPCRGLREYVRALIHLRNSRLALRHARRDNIRMLRGSNPFGIGYELHTPREHYIVLFNSNPRQEAKFTIPPGEWVALADENGIHEATGGENLPEKLTVSVPPVTGMLLERKDGPSRSTGSV